EEEDVSESVLRTDAPAFARLDAAGAARQLRFRFPGPVGAESEVEALAARSPSEAESVGAVFHFHTHASLLAHWPMDEGEGAAVQDLRGAHHGELLNSPPWGHSWANPFPRLHSAQHHSALLAAEAGAA